MKKKTKSVEVDPNRKEIIKLETRASTLLEIMDMIVVMAHETQCFGMFSKYDLKGLATLSLKIGSLHKEANNALIAELLFGTPGVKPALGNPGLFPPFENK